MRTDIYKVAFALLTLAWVTSGCKELNGRAIVDPIREEPCADNAMYVPPMFLSSEFDLPENLRLSIDGEEVINACTGFNGDETGYVAHHAVRAIEFVHIREQADEQIHIELRDCANGNVLFTNQITLQRNEYPRCAEPDVQYFGTLSLN